MPLRHARISASTKTLLCATCWIPSSRNMGLYQREDLLFLEAGQPPVSCNNIFPRVGVPEEEKLAAGAECSVSWAITYETHTRRMQRASRLGPSHHGAQCKDSLQVQQRFNLHHVS
ncbi:hypothetical protein PMIN01_04978 [Paraphaeosphaeria minitans]|uniref:Uncharacterized protein n=1 Tax=Paraphaeosphaeria minitans TaxID=565426 RepID=A0A9P6KSY7_9PLEO|nr:hypothetical protein PMIN01_04978 [Paraphaeosphaeria minitans]